MRSPRLVAPLATTFLALVLAACGGGGGGPECEDGEDNDADGLIDDADPSCAAGADTEDAEDPVRDCNDGEDNDGDDLVDFPADPGCDNGQDNSELNSPVPQCDDGQDNDDDGLTDYPDDPGCSSPLQNTEEDDCPDGVNCPECGNGADDDDDGDTDFPADDGCTAASDDAERTADPTACAQLPFSQLPQSGLVAGVLVAGTSVTTSGVCGGAGAEMAYEMYIESPVVMVATTDITGTAFDTILYVRERCGEMDTELGCNDNANGTTMRSTLTVALDPGFYYLIVDGDAAGSVGGFQLQVTFYPGLGTPCDPLETDACAPGLTCRTPFGATENSCEYPVCNDGRDDDGDDLTDFPFDPGCGSIGDTTEDDDCPSGPNCPECGNGVDDADTDTDADYPMDMDCAYAGQVVEGCGDEQDPIVQITDDVTTGNTTGYHDNSTVSGSCGSTGGLDAIHFLTLPVNVQSMQVDTSGSTGLTDTVLYMDDASCDSVYIPDTNGAPTVCDDDSGSPGFQSLQTFGALPAGTYAITVDGYSSSSVGAYTLNVHAIAAPSEACTDPLFASGVIACPTDYPCDGAICAPPDCGNTVDDDGDTFVGFPTDPGCTSALDADETDNCPSGPGCPSCGNGDDDDMDGATDYPEDINCSSASSNTESCTDTDPIGTITGPVTTGTTTGLTSNFSGSCIASTGPDKVFLLELPAMATTLQLDTIGTGFDTVLMLKTAACEATDLACNDESGGAGTSLITRTNQAAGTYAVVVDGYNGQNGNFTLNVRGTVASGAACNSPLFPSGALTCAAGEYCNGVMCVPAACNDAVDGDGDGDGNGYPLDPGCTSISDSTEEDTCPSGIDCPRCANTVDDDGDGMNNYPADPNCIAASTDDESGCASATDAFAEITGPVTTGMLAAGTAGNDLEPVCVAAGASGRDLAFELNVPYPLQNLYLNTNGSTVNTILALRTNGCNPANEIACDDTHGDDDSDAYIARGATAAGRYAVLVDANSTATGAFTLNIKGVIPQGGSCSPALEANGLFVCAATSHCAGTAGSETCVPFACADGISNDADGLVDAADSGCLSGADDSEVDPGTAPECADGISNDADGLIDYPADLGCKRASDPLELTCVDATGVTELTTAHVTNTTIGAGDDSTPGGACSAGSAAPDRVYSITIPGTMSSLTFDAGYNPVVPAFWDRVVYVRKDQCATDLACSSSDLVTLTNATAGTYFVFVDGGSTASGTFELAVRGTIASGQACDPVQIQAGMFNCAAGTSCRDNVCSP